MYAKGDILVCNKSQPSGHNNSQPTQCVCYPLRAFWSRERCWAMFFHHRIPQSQKQFPKLLWVTAVCQPKMDGWKIIPWQVESIRKPWEAGIVDRIPGVLNVGITTRANLDSSCLHFWDVKSQGCRDPHGKLTPWFAGAYQQ